VLRLPGALSLEDLSPEWAWGGSSGEGVRVAVVDSGIEANHPDLHGKVDSDGGIAVTLDQNGEVVVAPGQHDDAFGHGTACASIIHRLAPGAAITSVRVLGSGLVGKANAFLAGLGWAVERGFDVINLSLGTSRRDWALAFYEVCDRAYFQGSFVVTAANNIARPSFPSLYASVASVACNLSKDPLRFHYNPDPPTEFLAPGIDIEVSWRGGGRIVGTGNSYAAPHIAGVSQSQAPRTSAVPTEDSAVGDSGECERGSEARGPVDQRAHVTLDGGGGAGHERSTPRLGPPAPTRPLLIFVLRGLIWLRPRRINWRSAHWVEFHDHSHSARPSLPARRTPRGDPGPCCHGPSR
jgi:subtilisin